MRTSRRSRTLASRLAVLSAAVGAAALVGLGSTAAQAAPTKTATPSTAAATPAASTTTAATTTASTTTAATTTASTTTAATTTASTTTVATTTTGPRNAPGPPCPGVTSVLTPVLCIPTGSGEDQPAPVGTDGYLEFAGQVVNGGPAVSDATVVITLPVGLQLDPDSNPAISRLDQWWSNNSATDPTPLDCTPSQGGSVNTCATGPVPTGANFLVFVDVAAQSDAVAGTSGTLRMALQSTPTPGTFPATSVAATVDFVGTAHLQVHVTPLKASVTVGKSLTLVATIHNVGPNAAVEAAGIGLTFPDDFGNDYTFLITNSAPLPGFGAASAQLARSTFLRRAMATKAATKTATKNAAAMRTAVVKAAVVKAAAAQDPAPIGFWPVGTIAVGATASVQVVVKAVAVGHVTMNFDATSADASCDDGSNPDCENTAAIELTAVAAVTTTATTPAATTTTVAPSTTPVSASAAGTPASAAALPNTGFEPTPWLGSAAAVILLGVGLMMLGAPRRRAYGRGHR